MKLKELFEKIYNGEISKDDVIVQHDTSEEEYDKYIMNDEFDYWYYDGEEISLSFFDKENEQFEYTIISENEFEKLLTEKEKSKRIAELKRELERLEKEN